MGQTHGGGGLACPFENYQMLWYEGEIHFNATNWGGGGAQIFLHASEKRGVVRTIETFAGIGGWSQVLSHFDDMPMLWPNRGYSVVNPMVWIAAGLANVGRVVGSPPCTPWSGAGSNKGLSCDDGLVFQSHLDWAAIKRMKLVVLENVPGLAKHADFKNMVRMCKRKLNSPILVWHPI